jgi:hypothetical protein
MTNYYFETDEGMLGESALWGSSFYFANLSDLMDHFQSLYKCTSNEIEFSDEYKNGDMFKKHIGLIDKEFCKNHNAKFGLNDLNFYKNSDHEINDLYI